MDHNLNRMPSGAETPEDPALLAEVVARMREVAETVGIPEDKISEQTVTEAARRALNAEARRGVPVTADEVTHGAEDMTLVDALVAQKELENLKGNTMVEADSVVVSLRAWKEQHGA